jgi:hypothetical protein
MHPPLRHWDIGSRRMLVAAHALIEWAGGSLKLLANWKLMLCRCAFAKSGVSMADVRAESMVGGTMFHRESIQREISRVLVLNLSGKVSIYGDLKR